MTIHLLPLQSNSASELGGAIYSIQPSISIQDRAALNVADDVFTIGDLLLNTVNMSLNTANQGGCMYVTGNGANVTAVNSNFDRYVLFGVGQGTKEEYKVKYKEVAQPEITDPYWHLCMLYALCTMLSTVSRATQTSVFLAQCSVSDGAGASCSEVHAGTATTDALLCHQ